MIDLHSHILPEIDDGAADMAMALEMARMTVAGGVCVMACTPHIMPGVYNNAGPQIWQATERLQAALDQNGIALRLVPGADVHLVPDIVSRLRSGAALTLAASRYVLVEPSHHIAMPNIVDIFFNIIAAGYHPVLTHPERLAWIRPRYALIEQLFQSGIWMQLTASSLTGDFGKEPLYWAQRMLDEGKVHILASDCHNVKRRPPNLRAGYEAAAKRIGEREAQHLVIARPQAIMNDKAPAYVPAPATSRTATETFDGKPDLYASNHAKGSFDRPLAARSDNGARIGRHGYLDRMRRFIGAKR